MKKVAVIGGGISGLVAAYSISKKGHEVVVFEKKAEIGGVMQSYREGDFLVEKGPNSMMISSSTVEDFFKEIGLADEILEGNAKAKKRFILKNGKLNAVPMSPMSFLKTDLFSFFGKLRLFAEPFIEKGNGKESVAEFVTRRLGSEVLDYAVNPLVAGVYAGDPKKLSLAHVFPFLNNLEQEFGSLVKGAFKSRRNKKPGKIKPRLITLKSGLSTLPNQLEKSLNVKCGVMIKSISEVGETWQVKGNSLDGDFTNDFDDVVLAAPTPSLAQIDFSQTLNDAFAELGEIHYAPISVAHIAFKKKQVFHPLDGYGFLVPEKEQRRILGCIFTSTLFEGRAPEGTVLLSCFIGGDRQPKLSALPEDELKELLIKELGEIIGAMGKPDFFKSFSWTTAIPQYTLGYEKYVDLIEDLTKNNRGLHFTGSYHKGVAVGDCIENGLKLAEVF